MAGAVPGTFGVNFMPNALKLQKLAARGAQKGLPSLLDVQRGQTATLRNVLSRPVCAPFQLLCNTKMNASGLNF